MLVWCFDYLSYKAAYAGRKCIVGSNVLMKEMMSYVGYTRGHLYARVGGHKSTSSSVRKHYDNDHASAVPEDLLSCFKVLKKCMNKFDCLVNKMLYIKQLTPSLNVQTDSIRAKVFV